MWGKNPPGGHKRDNKMSQVQLLTSAIQFLFISVPETVICEPEKQKFPLFLQEFDNKCFSDTETSDIAK